MLNTEYYRMRSREGKDIEKAKAPRQAECELVKVFARREEVVVVEREKLLAA